MTIRYEGVRFSDGSVALRRIDDDPCERMTRTFETIRECNEELGRLEVIEWLADAVPRPEAPKPWGQVTVRAPTAQEVAYLMRYPDRCFPGPAELAAEGSYEQAEECQLRGGKFHHPRCDKPNAHQGSCIDPPASYEPTEEADEP